MSFDSRAGTRGARQPNGRAWRWLNRFVAPVIRRRGGRVIGFDILVLHTIGRRSGEARMTPVSWLPAADGSLLIIASAAGAPENPAWYYNLAARPDRVRIEVGSKTIEVRAEQLHGAERAAEWERIVTTAPRFAEYQVKTDRELPVIRLTPRH
ncbi:nitroreductase/quinone reductase family protein [Kribbella sp. NPDC051586]|uniref:nitroreductase/quinone reductase family protein n=1 Tax=Kribbella sp. NPDC051586 TaxID=3364118 RepID=UPI0037AA699B